MRARRAPHRIGDLGDPAGQRFAKDHARGLPIEPPIVSATWSRPKGGVSRFSILSASSCAMMRSRYDRDTTSVGVSIGGDGLISILRRGRFATQASTIPPGQDRRDPLFRPTGDINRSCAVAPSMAVATSASMLPSHGAQSIPAARLADDRVDFDSLALGTPIAHRDQPPEPRSTSARLRPAQARQLPRGARSRSGSSRNRTAAPRASGCRQAQAHGHGARRFQPAWHDRFRSANRRSGMDRRRRSFRNADESDMDIGWKRSLLVPIPSLFADAEASSGDAGIFD